MRPADNTATIPALAELYDKHRREVEAELRAEFPTGNLEIIRDYVLAEARRRALMELRSASTN